MEDFKGEVSFRKEDFRIRVVITYTNKRLSLAGDIYERGRDVGGGQCYEELLEQFPESGHLVELWQRWHLNDLKAGDEVQEAYLRALVGMGRKHSSYEANCTALHLAGILEHNGYKYGSEWKFEEVPVYILEELKTITGK